VFERSGPPEAPDDAIDAAGYPGQVVVEPWHGTTNATLALGESYHRSHVRIRGSQVRQLAPGHADRRDEVRIVLTTIDRS
jgi:alcohol dehydrogenase